MTEDHIIKEVRQAGYELAGKYNFNVHSYFEGLRKNQKTRILKKKIKKIIVK